MKYSNTISAIYVRGVPLHDEYPLSADVMCGQGYHVASGLIRLRGNLRAARDSAGFFVGLAGKINHRSVVTEIAR